VRGRGNGHWRGDGGGEEEPRDEEPRDPLDEARRLGGDWAGTRPRFDDPMSWSLPLVRVARIDVRLHLFFIVFVVVELLQAWLALPRRGGDSTFGAAIVLILLAWLFWSVLLHEFGHCLAARAGGGEAHEILMWPLGGLASCRSAPSWKAHLFTAVGGPAVNAGILLIAVPALGWLTGVWWGVAIPSPLGLSLPFEVERSWWLTALYLLIWVNLLLLLFNLLPLFPLDGGRILQALLWPRLGYATAMRLSVRAGYIGAIALAVFALVYDRTLLLALALFGGLVCYQTVHKLNYTQQVLGFEPGPEGELEPAPDPEALQREAQRRRKEEEAAELDRVLNKINEAGLGSLTARERRLLKEATERRRRSSEGTG